MVFIPGDLLTWVQRSIHYMVNAAKTKTVSIDAFWMDQTEITNGEYRQFVNWVRDSIALTFLSRMSEETEAAKYFTTVKIYGQEEEDTILNWKAKIRGL